MRFLVDENLSPQHAAELRGMGHDAVSVLEIGLAGAPDPTVRITAIRSGRTLVTLDADFGNIRRYPTGGTPGVVWLRLHRPTERAIAAALRRFLARAPGHDIAGKLVVVDDDKIRIRSEPA